MDFDGLYNAYAGDVYRYALSLCRNRHIAEDITSETFLSAIKAADTSERSESRLGERLHFSAH